MVAQGSPRIDEEDLRRAARIEQFRDPAFGILDDVESVPVFARMRPRFFGGLETSGIDTHEEDPRMTTPLWVLSASASENRRPWRVVIPNSGAMAPICNPPITSGDERRRAPVRAAAARAASHSSGPGTDRISAVAPWAAKAATISSSGTFRSEAPAAVFRITMILKKLAPPLDFIRRF